VVVARYDDSPVNKKFFDQENQTGADPETDPGTDLITLED